MLLVNRYVNAPFGPFFLRTNYRDIVKQTQTEIENIYK